MAQTHDQKLTQLNLTLPTPITPFGVYRPIVSYQVGQYLHLSLSGHGPFSVLDNTLTVGKCGQDRTKEEGARAAYLTGLGCLSTIRHHLGGSLHRFRRVIKSLVLVNCSPDFTDQIFVANGFAKLFKDVFGADAGVGARSAVGTGSLPMNQTVEVEMIVEVEQAVGQEASWWVDAIPELDSVINCCGHFTSLGGSLLHPRALHAMSLQSQRFVDLNALLLHAGHRIAQLTKAPPGYSVQVTGGAASGIALATVACMCRQVHDVTTMERMTAGLPDVAAMNFDCVYVLVDGGSDLRWLAQVRLTGATVVMVGTTTAPMTRELLLATVRQLGGVSKIACLLYFEGANPPPHGMSLEQVVAAAAEIAAGEPPRSHHPVILPVVVDAAARLPPVANLSRFIEVGASAVLFSGGKALRGPQSSGFMIAQDWLVDRARSYACPREDSVCRGMKTTKESIVGLVAALEAFLEESAVYPAQPNYFASIAAASFHQRLAGGGSGGSSHAATRLSTGLEEGLVDVQPNGHALFFVDLLHVVVDTRLLTNKGEQTSPVSTMYGSGVNHGSPLVIRPINAPTALAARLCRIAPGLKRIAVNTTLKGIFVNPILIKDVEEAKYVGTRIADEIMCMVREQQSKM